MNIYMKVNLVALTFLAVLNYISIGKLTQVVTALGRISKDGRSISVKKSLIHNAIVALTPPVAVIFLDLSYLLGGSEEAATFADTNGKGLVAIVEVNKALFVMFIGLLGKNLTLLQYALKLFSQAYTLKIVSAPELVMCFCQQILASDTSRSCKQSKLASDDLCKRLRLCLTAHEALSNASGSILLVLLSMCSFELVIAAYYALLDCFVLTAGNSTVPTYVIILDMVGNGLYCVSSLKRLFFLANNSQGVADSFQGAVDALLELERKEETCTHEVIHTVHLKFNVHLHYH